MANKPHDSDTPQKADCSSATCSRSSDTPETEEQLQLERITAPWTEHVLADFARKMESERNTARVVATDALRELDRILDTGDTYASREIVQNLKDFLRGDSSENADVLAPAGEKTN